MAKIPFDIKYRPQIESGEYKVKTRFGEPVEIVKWDCRGEYPILACIFDGDTDDSAFFSNDGKGMSGSEDVLYIITSEPELTEFEKAVKNMMSPYVKMPDEIHKENAAHLLELARKELESEFDGKAMLHVSKKTYECGKRDGKAEALKDLPRWRKIGRGHNYSLDTEFLINGRYLEMTDYLNDVYEVALSELEKLPEFKEN